MDTICSCDKAMKWRPRISSMWWSTALEGSLCKNFNFNLAHSFLCSLKDMVEEWTSYLSLPQLVAFLLYVLQATLNEAPVELCDIRY